MYTVYHALINIIGLKQISQRLRSFTVKSVCFLLKSFLLFPSPKFSLRSADTPPTHTHTYTDSCRQPTDVWLENRKVLSQTKNCRLLVCTESVQNRRYACADEKLARIPRHSTAYCASIPCAMGVVTCRG